MNEYLLKFLEKNTSFDKGEIQEIMKDMIVETHKKGTILLRQGDISKKCFFVLVGCIRQYSCDKYGKEISHNFFTEEQAVTMFKSYKQSVPSDYFLSCLEDTTLLIGDVSFEEQMYHKFPKLQQITRAMLEVNFGETQETSAMFKGASPEDRYRKLAEKRPELIKRVPQHQLASYLGITPESLSRIRKRMSQDSNS